MVVAVVGAGGPTGAECVKRLVATGSTVRAVVRDPSKYAGAAAPWGADANVQVVAGDVTKGSTLSTAFQGAKNVIVASSGKTYFSAHEVDNKGVANVAASAKAAGVQRVVLVSSQLVTPQNRWHPVRILLNNARWSLMDNKLAGEEALRSSGVAYTVVRPGGLTNGPGGKAQLVAGQGDKLSAGSISRADVAAVCVSALDNPAAENVTLEIGTAKGTSAAPAVGTFEQQLQKLWEGLKPDARK